MPDFNLTREQAIKLICRVTDRDDPYWEYLVEEFYDETTDSMPTIFDVLKPLGISREEIDRADLYGVEG